MKIIAFDLGRIFAFAHNIDAQITTHHVFFEPAARPHRFACCYVWLYAHISELKQLDAVVYETPFARGCDATRSLWGYACLIEAVASRCNLPVVDVAVPTIKKFATEHGKACKEDMIAAAKKFGYHGNNEHEADAVCLLEYAKANLERVLPANVPGGIMSMSPGVIPGQPLPKGAKALGLLK